MPRIIIVGPSCSGKTTLADLVGRDLNLPVVHMDDFRQPGQFSVRLPGGERVRSFENPALWDHERIAIRLFTHLEERGGFVAEGNHLLTYSLIARIPDTVRFYIDVPFVVSLQRRGARGRNSVADRSFAAVGNSETNLYVAPQRNLPGVIQMDGTFPAATLASSIATAARRAKPALLQPA